MNNELYYNYELPLSIELLFNNSLLDTMALMCVISGFTKRKNGVSIDELAFYYSIITSEVKILGDKTDIIFDSSEAKYDIDARYLTIKDKVRLMITYLANLDYINIFISTKDGINSVFIKANKVGNSIVKALESDYYLDLQNKTKDIIGKMNFSMRNVKKVSGVEL